MKNGRSKLEFPGTFYRAQTLKLGGVFSHYSHSGQLGEIYFAHTYIFLLLLKFLVCYLEQNLLQSEHRTKIRQNNKQERLGLEC